MKTTTCAGRMIRCAVAGLAMFAAAGTASATVVLDLRDPPPNPPFSEILDELGIPFKGNEMTATGWVLSTLSPAFTWRQDRLHRSFIGLGVAAGNNNVDTEGNKVEGILFEFDSAVSIHSIDFQGLRRFPNLAGDAETAEIYLGDLTAAVLDGLTLADLGPPDATFLGNGFADVWISTDDGLYTSVFVAIRDDGDTDRFRIQAITVTEPATALLLAALLAAAGVRRRRRVTAR